MKKMGYANPKVDHIIVSPLVAAKYIKKNMPDVKKVFVVGEKSMRTCFEAEGIEVIGAEQDVLDPDMILDPDEFEALELEPEVGAVVVGIDLSYNRNKLCLASLYIT